MGNFVLALFARNALAADARLHDLVQGSGACALAWNVASEAEVDRAMAWATRSGARLVRAGQRASWGGYSGYLADPGGHLWEVAFNPYFPIHAVGRLRLPDDAETHAGEV